MKCGGGWKSEQVDREGIQERKWLLTSDLKEVSRQPHWSLGEEHSRWKEQRSQRCPARSTPGLLGQGGQWSWGTENRTTNPGNATERLWGGGDNSARFLLSRVSCCMVKNKTKSQKNVLKTVERVEYRFEVFIFDLVSDGEVLNLFFF